MMNKIYDFSTLEKIDETPGSEVYRTKPDESDKQFIIRVLKTSYPHSSEISGLKQEYELIRTTDIRGVIRIYDILEYNEKLIIVQEDFNGISLNTAFQKKPVSIKTFLRIGLSLAETLGHLHKSNIVHMAVTPGNILFNPENHQVKITNFGISTPLTLDYEEIYTPEIIKDALAFSSPEQIGRMNRQVDYRTDLYSLGVTFYAILTGSPPFISNDPLEVIHAHLAQKPLPPVHLNPDIPVAVSNIILKLMSKSPEDRYQNSFGLMADLQTCLDHFSATGEIPDFKLGARDISLKFSIPQKVYGRENEINFLLDGFHRTSRGNIGLMLVSGYAGIGKTALINEIQKPIIEKKGFFISGKYEHARQDVPYSAIIQAFEGLIKQLLFENRVMLGTWKEKLIAALSPNEAIITQMIPYVSHIIGSQPTITDMGSEEFKNRFDLAFKNFVKVFAEKSHPLVIFLDDLQWADLSSLQLLKSMITDSEITYLYIIAAYRNNEVSKTHPLNRIIKDVKATDVAIHNIILTPIEIHDIQRLIIDFLACRESDALTLAELIYKKTNGNPFFINQFIKTLYDLKLLQHDPEKGWQWDIFRIQQLEITDNVVDLLSNRIKHQPRSLVQMLKIGACIGNAFDLEKLNAIHGNSMGGLRADVNTAIDDGYIELSNNVFKFRHDRIREAVYAMIPEKKKKEIHYQIGKFEIENAYPDNLDVFSIADHLNHATDMIIHQEEKMDLAWLNLRAGEKAISSAAYSSALTYFEHGISLLRKNTWMIRYSLSHGLYKGAVAAACLDGKFDVMEKYCAVALPECKDTLDQVTFFKFRILAHISQNNLPEAVRTGLTILERLEITFPKKPNKLHVLLEMIRVRLALKGKTTETLLNLPQATDPAILAAGKIINIMVSPAFQSNPNLFFLIVIKHLLLSLKYGNTAFSAVAYSSYGILLCAIPKDFDGGYEFGILAFRLMEKLNDYEFKSHVIQIFNVFIRHWKDNIQDALQPLLEGHQAGKETGNLEVSANNLFLYGGHNFLTGKALNLQEEDLTQHIRTVRKMNQKTALNYIKINKQVVLNLMGKNNDPIHLIGKAYNEKEMLPVHHRAEDLAALSFLYGHKMFLSYLFGHYHEALNNAGFMKKFIGGAVSTHNILRYHLFSSLIRLALYNDATVIEKGLILRKVATSRKHIKKYAYHSPGNAEFAFYLLTAEHAGVTGKYEKAVTFYDKAIASSRKYGLVQHEALCNELAARFYLSRGHIKTARVYMHDARLHYSGWGATAKVKQLEACYSEIFSAFHDATGSERAGAFGASPAMQPRDAAKNLDFSTLMKASEAVFGEIVLSRLLKRLMCILIENAGAEKGFIILPENNLFLIEAEGTIGSEEVQVLKSVPVDRHKGLSAAIVCYVGRMKETIILNNAEFESEFNRDPYIIKNRPKSVLCLPVLNQGRLSAILYLENNLATNVFTQERLRLLNMLSSQIAVAIDNAKLYDHLEQKVEERTHQLKKAQEENLRKAHRAGMADIAKETLHNVGNILNSVKTITEMMNASKKDTALSGLISANHIVRKHQDNIRNFLVNDPKGMKLIDSYLTLEDLFVDENTFNGKQLARLREKVNEIAKVIHTLQNYIGSDDSYLENAQLKEEIKFVLETKRDSLAQSNIHVKEIYREIPVIKVQKSKLAYILDNVINNAKEALENVTIPEKILRVGLECIENSVFLHIRDNGEGISKENIKKIFFHGFTTKPGRTGHSLHNCANNMTEMGGNIQAESNGAGKGATFTLEFPIRN